MKFSRPKLSALATTTEPVTRVMSSGIRALTALLYDYCSTFKSDQARAIMLTITRMAIIATLQDGTLVEMR